MLAVMTDTVTNTTLRFQPDFGSEKHVMVRRGKRNPILVLHSPEFLSQIPTFHIPSLTHRNAGSGELGEHGDLGGLGVPEPRKGEAGGGERLNG